MRPQGLKTKIFLDSGSPDETKQALNLLGFLDGQTTNPTLIAKNPQAQARLSRGEKFTELEIYDFYKKVVTEISELVPGGSVSIEVYSDKDTTFNQLFTQGKDMFCWIPNAHIKYPITTPGLEAARRSVKEGMRVNMTLCFSQEQAAAVYAATDGASLGQVFVSPFVGRLDDKGENGMSLIVNMIKMFKAGDGHVEVLVASVRSLNHFLYSLSMGVGIITSPLKILQEWKEQGMQIPDGNFVYSKGDLIDLPYRDLDLNQDWKTFNIYHPLTEAGIDKFSLDWNGLIKKP